MRRRAATGAEIGVVPPMVHAVLRSSGEPRDAAMRGPMGPRRGHDFSRVRVHSDSVASESARAVNALALEQAANPFVGAGVAPEACIHSRGVLQRQTDGSDGGVSSLNTANNTNTNPAVSTDTGPQQEFSGKPPLGELVRFPVMDDIVKSATVEAARQSDWVAGLSDFKERGGWIIWQGSPRDASGVRDDVHGTYIIKEWPMATGALDDEPDSDPRDVIDPGRPPSNDSLNFMVGHYHQHAPLDPSQNRDPANFPVGPSDVDNKIANDLGDPGVVRDFTDIKRTVVTDYRYGPPVQEHK